MNHLKFLTISATLAMVLASCSSDNGTTPVAEGDLSLQGIAATGYAMTGADVAVTDAEGEVLWTGVTNELGAYLGKLDKKSIDMPFSITVTKGEHELEHIVAELPAEGEEPEVVGHVNPITDMGAKAIREFAKELKGLDPVVADSVCQARIEALLGEGVRFQAFARNKNYVAAVEGDETVIPSSEDMVLHTLGERAGLAGLKLGEYLATQARERARLLSQDAGFQAELALQMKNFGMDSAKIQNGLQNMFSEEKADSLNQQLNQIRHQYQNMEIPSECMNAEVKAQVEKVVKLQTQLQANPTDTEIQTQLRTEAQTLEASMTQLQTTCQISFEIPDVTGEGDGEGEGRDTETGSGSEANSSSESGAGQV